MNVVCHKTKVVSVLLKEEPNVPLLVIWTRQKEVLPPDNSVDAVKRAVKQQVLLIFNCLHGAMPTDTLLPRHEAPT